MGETCAVISPAYDRVFRTALITQLVIGCLAALLLDGGVTARVVGVAMLGFWLGVAILVTRHRFQPSKFDLAFIQWGFWPVLVIAFLRQALA